MSKEHLRKNAFLKGGVFASILTIATCATGIISLPASASTSGAGIVTDGPEPSTFERRHTGTLAGVRFHAGTANSVPYIEGGAWAYNRDYVEGGSQPFFVKNEDIAIFSDYAEIEYSYTPDDANSWKDFAGYGDDETVYYKYIYDAENQEKYSYEFGFRYDYQTGAWDNTQSTYIRLKTVSKQGSITIYGPNYKQGGETMLLNEVYELKPFSDGYYELYWDYNPATEFKSETNKVINFRIDDPEGALAEYGQVKLEVAEAKPDSKTKTSFQNYNDKGSLLGYFSLNLYGKKDDGSYAQITDLGKSVKIYLQLDKKFIDFGKIVEDEEKNGRKTPLNYFVVRKHKEANGKFSYTKIAATSDISWNTLNFETDKFSDWAFGVDVEGLGEEGVANAETYDGIVTYFVLGGVSLAGIVGGTVFAIYTRKQAKKD